MVKLNIWDFWAGRYERLWVQKFSLGPTRSLVIGEIRSLLPADPAGREIDLLDAGCGTGQLAEDCLKQLGQWKLRVTGMDQSEKMIEAARQKSLPGVRFLQGDAQALPFAWGRFDLVTCCHSLPYYQDQAGALRQFRKVLKPGGYLLLAQAAENSFYDTLALKLVKLTTGRASYPSAAETAALLQKAGFTLLKQKRLQGSFFLPSIILSIGRRDAL